MSRGKYTGVLNTHCIARICTFFSICPSLDKQSTEVWKIGL
jgi:hypothetical protein